MTLAAKLEKAAMKIETYVRWLLVLQSMLDLVGTVTKVARLLRQLVCRFHSTMSCAASVSLEEVEVLVADSIDVLVLQSDSIVAEAG